ncbi:vanillate O-demethylase ferredoxin subunit [Sphingomonas vulcanisoli]|uniref:Vanillate O-demethylase ferredoxin subunit n=1 Tax=Sphingomonas vulcanisoli TaxID=1658060 RepID=A0ABX0TTA1_9SPHN|nr:PDR/VanB family oxidoreductase [Sphingomonas vulcanisoli]NIJ08743.1 vanillate O-demethylase ferredoxin subunit [Sphingomonas vulcanisoli]
MSLPVIVARKQVEAEDIFSFELVSRAGEALPPFSAGSHVDVALPGGMIRQYSICNDPAESHRYLLCVQREGESRGGSRALADDIGEGDALEISMPRNHFPLMPNAPHYLLLGGGIGITPILCMAERLAQIGTHFEMHYCTRNLQRTAFAARIAAAPFAAQVSLHHDDGPAEQRFDRDKVLSSVPEGTHLYICGPKGFMDWILDGARSSGWDSSRLHMEYFSSGVIDKSADGSFDVKLASSNRVIHIPAEKSVSEALAAEGIEIPISCESGVCGTCLTRVLDGIPEHRDVYLTDEEKAKNDQFLPCCSRAESALLVLDL